MKIKAILEAIQNIKDQHHVVIHLKVKNIQNPTIEMYNQKIILMIEMIIIGAQNIVIMMMIITTKNIKILKENQDLKNVEEIKRVILK